uniref:Serpentine receptor class gamma n=2 Tax=Caenorhabditis japonica TaxID=281687 RepID=A0A8R1DYY7_CAEJA
MSNSSSTSGCDPNYYSLSNSLFIDIYYPLLNYLHCAQPLIQIFLTTNRAISILDPLNYDNVWSTKFTLVTIFILIAPFLLIWNTIISPKEILFYFGGFFMKSSRIVEWANMSLFLLVIRSVAVAITVLSTGVMFMRMSRMKKRLKSSERALCIGCASNSVCFMIPSLFEALATFSPDYKASWLNYFIQPLAWDVLNIPDSHGMLKCTVATSRVRYKGGIDAEEFSSIVFY